jgi:hypothetical protein
MPFLKRDESERAERGERGGDRLRTLEERMHRDENPERRWEYHVLRVGPKARAEHQLNELGNKGWQLVQVIETEGHLAFYFERELIPLPDSDSVEDVIASETQLYDDESG